MGQAAYEIYNSTGRDLTSEEQLGADAALNSFMAANKADVLIAEIPLMPLTTLTLREFSRISALLNFELESNQLWERFVAGDLSLTVAERTQIGQLGSDWLG